MIHGSCLCGAVSWQAEPPLELMSHCHCSMCRKAHGAPFGTYVACKAEGFRWVSGENEIQGHESSPGNVRHFCGRCGSLVPGGADAEGRLFMPAGCLDDDPSTRPIVHIFAASRPDWSPKTDDLPEIPAAPEGFGITAIENSGPTDADDAIRGSCLCGEVAYRITGEPILARNCHCRRCQKARAAAYTSNLVVAIDDVEFVRGQDRIREYKVPDAQFFTHSFCSQCGSGAPRVDEGRGIAVIPMGGLDDDPGIRPREHIWVDSKATWFEITDDLPAHREGPP